MKKGAQRIEFRSVSDLTPYEQNPRTHSESQIKEIARSIERFGFTNPILLDGKNGIIAGHGRLSAAVKLKLDQVPCINLEGMSEAEKRAYVIADNQLALSAGWDNAILASELSALHDDGFDITLTGFTPDDLADLKATLETVKSGGVLGVMDVSLDNPTTQVEHSQVWQVGDHVLVCSSVFTGWSLWKPFLEGSSTLFCPYPNPLVPLSEKAKTHKLVMVQPDEYLAGHLIDKFKAVHGDDSCKLVSEK